MLEETGTSQVPGSYRQILKCVLKDQIRLLVQQLSEQGEEECCVITACVKDGTFSYFGSEEGNVYLESGEKVKDFLNHCQSRQKNVIPTTNKAQKSATVPHVGHNKTVTSQHIGGNTVPQETQLVLDLGQPNHDSFVKRASQPNRCNISLISKDVNRKSEGQVKVGAIVIRDQKSEQSIEPSITNSSKDMVRKPEADIENVPVKQEATEYQDTGSLDQSEHQSTDDPMRGINVVVNPEYTESVLNESLDHDSDDHGEEDCEFELQTPRSQHQKQPRKRKSQDWHKITFGSEMDLVPGLQKDILAEKLTKFYSKAKKSGQSELHQLSSLVNIRGAVNRTAKNKIKKYNCHLCNKSFARKYRVHYHIKNVHSNLVSETICQRCGQKFSSKGSRIRHEDIVHNRIKKYSCFDCGMAFYFKITLDNHIFKQHGDPDIKRQIREAKEAKKLAEKVEEPVEKFTCEVCGLNYNHKRSLTAHMASKHGGKCYVCEMCGAEFTYSSSLRKHKIRKHQPFTTH